MEYQYFDGPNGTTMRSLVYTDDEMKKKEDMIRAAYKEGEISYDEMISAIDEVGSEHVEYESEYEDWNGNIHTSWHRMRY